MAQTIIIQIVGTYVRAIRLRGTRARWRSTEAPAETEVT